MNKKSVIFLSVHNLSFSIPNSPLWTFGTNVCKEMQELFKETIIYLKNSSHTCAYVGDAVGYAFGHILRGLVL
jgi:hypothetical protein